MNRSVRDWIFRECGRSLLYSASTTIFAATEGVLRAFLGLGVADMLFRQNPCSAPKRSGCITPRKVCSARSLRFSRLGGQCLLGWVKLELDGMETIVLLCGI